MKACTTIAFLAFSAWTANADELEDAYKNLKAAEAAKDPDAVLKWSAETSAHARKLAAIPKPDLKGVEDAETILKSWQDRIDYAKQVDTYSEYALYAMALQSIDPLKTIALMEELEKRNEKSEYLSKGYVNYLVALAKSNQTPKMLAAGERALARDPGNEDVLLVLADGYMNAKQPDKALANAQKLVELMGSKAKPEGIDDATWEKKKKAVLGRGYWIAGVTQADRKQFADANRTLRAALPYIQDQPAMAGPAYFFLGVACYNLSRGSKDRRQLLQDALNFSERAAAFAGPFQQPAVKNYNSIKAELAGAPVRKQ